MTCVCDHEKQRSALQSALRYNGHAAVNASAPSGATASPQHSLQGRRIACDEAGEEDLAKGFEARAFGRKDIECSRAARAGALSDHGHDEGDAWHDRKSTSRGMHEKAAK
eukprot:3108864-Pleurochrysis_carterae.AAC.1